MMAETLKSQQCTVRECGARVYALQTATGELLVDPRQMELAVPEEDGMFRLVQGYRPHRFTCVDIQRRRDAGGGA